MIPLEPVEVDGKLYLTEPPRVGRFLFMGVIPAGAERPSFTTAYLNYFSTRNGKRFGPIRMAHLTEAKPSSVAYKLGAILAERHGLDYDAMVAEYEDNNLT